MKAVEATASRGRVNSGSSPTPAEREALRELTRTFGSAPTCSFCRKSSNDVKLVIADPANLNNICESCTDECVRVFVCACVC